MVNSRVTLGRAKVVAKVLGNSKLTCKFWLVTEKN